MSCSNVKILQITTTGTNGSGATLYANDGILTANRTVDGNGNNLTFSNIPVFTINSPKVTITGLLDPIGLEFTQTASNPGGVANNTLWINSADGELYIGSGFNLQRPISVDPDNAIQTGADGKLYLDAATISGGNAAPSVDAFNVLTTGSDSGLYLSTNNLISIDVGNALATGADGNLYVTSGSVTIVSADADNAISTGSDAAAYLTYSDLLSADADNSLVTGADKKLFVPEASITYTGLTDTPNAYSGDAGKIVAIATGETGIAHVGILNYISADANNSLVTGADENLFVPEASITYTGLTDTPNAYLGDGGKIVAIATGESGISHVGIENYISVDSGNIIATGADGLIYSSGGLPEGIDDTLAEDQALTANRTLDTDAFNLTIKGSGINSLQYLNGFTLTQAQAGPGFARLYADDGNGASWVVAIPTGAVEFNSPSGVYRYNNAAVRPQLDSDSTDDVQSVDTNGEFGRMSVDAFRTLVLNAAPVDDVTTAYYSGQLAFDNTNDKLYKADSKSLDPDSVASGSVFNEVAIAGPTFTGIFASGQWTDAEPSLLVISGITHNVEHPATIQVLEGNQVVAVSTLVDTGNFDVTLSQPSGLGFDCFVTIK